MNRLQRPNIREGTTSVRVLFAWSSFLENIIVYILYHVNECHLVVKEVIIPLHMTQIETFWHKLRHFDTNWDIMTQIETFWHKLRHYDPNWDILTQIARQATFFVINRDMSIV